MLLGGFLLATVLAAWNPRVALLVLATSAGVLSGIPSRLGFPNVSLTMVLVAAVIVGSFLHDRVQRPPAPEKSLAGSRASALPPSLTWATLVLLVLSLTFHWARLLPDLSTWWRANLGDALTVGQTGVAGALRAVFILATGPLLLLRAGRHTFGPPGNRHLLHSLLGGQLLVALSPLALAALGLDPYVRPDQGRVDSGLVGLAQDPHALASYLTMGMFLFGVLALTDPHYGRRLRTGMLAVALGMSLLVFLSGSKAAWLSVGYGAGAVAIAILAARGVRGRSLRSISVVAVALPVVLLAVVFSPPVRTFLHDRTEQILSPRARAFFNPKTDVLDLPTVSERLALGGRASSIVALYPLWGVGAAGFGRTSTCQGTATCAQNAHNYWLQLVAEYGVAAYFWMALVVLGLRRVWRQAARGCSVSPGVLGALVSVCMVSLFAHPLLLPEMMVTFWLSASVRPRD